MFAFNWIVPRFLMIGFIGEALGGVLGGLFGGGDDEEEVVDARTPEQKAAAAALQQLANTGMWNGINLGQGYSGPLGYYTQSGAEGNALNNLIDLYGGSDLSTASNTLRKLTDTTFNPDDPSSGYAAFSRALAKSGEESASQLEREAAMTGNRFGTGIIKQKGELASDLSNQRGQYLANLYNAQQNRALAASQGLQSLASTKAGILQTTSQLGALQRQLKDQEAKDKYSEYLRQRNETLKRVDLLTAESNRNPYLGVSNYGGTTQSPFSMLANSVLGSLGKSIGSSAGGWLSGLFGGGNNGYTAHSFGV